MKKLAGAIVLAFVLIAIGYHFLFADKLAQQEEIQCKKFKTGEFTYSEKSNIRVIRDAHTQTEYNVNAGSSEDFIDKYNIHWQDECTYFLTLKSTNRPEGLDFSEQDTLWVTITATNDYIYEYSAFKTGKTFQGSLIKLKD